MHKMPGPKVRVEATKGVAIKAMVMAMFGVMVRPMVGPMPWIPRSNRVIQLISLKGINQGHLVFTSIELM